MDDNRLGWLCATRIRYGSRNGFGDQVIQTGLESDGGAAAARYLFSSKFACPVCNYALQELEPRLFSFNNPMGACLKCDGLGQIQFFDPARVVAYPHLSLAAGAIKGWDRRNQFYFQMLGSLAAHYGIDTNGGWISYPFLCSLFASGMQRQSGLSAPARTGLVAIVKLRATPPGSLPLAEDRPMSNSNKNPGVPVPVLVDRGRRAVRQSRLQRRPRAGKGDNKTLVQPSQRVASPVSGRRASAVGGDLGNDLESDQGRAHCG